MRLLYPQSPLLCFYGSPERTHQMIFGGSTVGEGVVRGIQLVCLQPLRFILHPGNLTQDSVTFQWGDIKLFPLQME